MKNKRKIKISKIEDKMLDIKTRLAIISSLSTILHLLVEDGFGLKHDDICNLAYQMTQNLDDLQKKFNQVELILKI